jgi:hypothetical protein
VPDFGTHHRTAESTIDAQNFSIIESAVRSHLGSVNDQFRPLRSSSALRVNCITLHVRLQQLIKLQFQTRSKQNKPLHVRPFSLIRYQLVVRRSRTSYCFCGKATKFAFLVTIHKPSLMDEPDLRPASKATLHCWLLPIIGW